MVLKACPNSASSSRPVTGTSGAGPPRAMARVARVSSATGFPMRPATHSATSTPSPAAISVAPQMPFRIRLENSTSRAPKGRRIGPWGAAIVAPGAPDTTVRPSCSSPRSTYRRNARLAS